MRSVAAERVRSAVAALRSRRGAPPPEPVDGAGVAIIVLNWNGRECTLRCLESLQRAELGGATIMVVDNGSVDGSTDAIRARFPQVRMVTLPENCGYAGGNNAGMRAALEAGATAVLLLNNDTEVAPDFLPPLLEALNGAPRAGAVSAAIMRFDSRDVLQEAYLELYFGFGIIRRRGVNALPGEGYDKLKRVDAGSGCCILIRAATLREVGLLDERYFAYHEEVDWCFRARKAGWQTYFQPYSRVWHHISKSTDVARTPRTTHRKPDRTAELANPLPVSWNPVRTYLGARNSVRFIRLHAWFPRRVYFWLSTLYNIPLQLLAAVLGREDDLAIGALRYRTALGRYCLEEIGVSGDRRPSVTERLRAAAWAPVALFRSLPREIARARREGATDQVAACASGHWDGVLDKPPPLERLGLRSPPPVPPLTGKGITIVVLNWNRGEETIACLESLAAADLQGATILVVDNGSTDGSAAKIRARFPDVRLIALPENQGYAGGNNAGIRAALDAGAEAVLLLNNDTRVAPDFLAPLMEAMNACTESGAVASAILRLDRPEMLDVAYSVVRFDQRFVVQIQGVNALRSEGFDRRLQVQVAVGCCVLLKAQALRRVGLLDEAYFAYHEDVDWCLRAADAGYRHFYEPYSQVYHRGSHSTGSLRDRPPPPPGMPSASEELPNAEPLPWNPVRAYLGARNTVRLLKGHAKRRQQLGFARAFLRTLPLEFTAVVLGREGLMRLGHWSWREMASVYFLERRGIARTPPALPLPRAGRRLRLALTVPLDLVWFWPRDVWRAFRAHRLDEMIEVLRGLRDGIVNRPLPLKRLGLR